MEMEVNAIGRKVPTKVEGRPYVPYKGAWTGPTPKQGARHAIGRMMPGDSKLCPDLATAIKRAGLKDGMTISFHHHLRDGDGVVNMVLDTIHSLGIKDICIFPTALFPVHKHLLQYLEDKTITRIEGSMNGPVGDWVSKGNLLPHVAVLRSHGGRVRAIHCGEVHIDVAFVAAPTADEYGNCHGMAGKNSCGPLGYARADVMFADRTVLVTDNLVPVPATPISISQKYIDHVVQVDSIGDNKKILSGTTEAATDKTQLEIARNAIEFLDAVGVIKDGMSFQAGAGGISQAASLMIGEKLEDKHIQAAWVDGGITAGIVKMYHKGLIRKLLNIQSFDAESVESMMNDFGHFEVTPDFYANPFNKGCLVNLLDTVILGATEVDVDFNVNVNTHSDGRLLHGIGGHQDTAAGAKVTVITCPILRKKFPIVRKRVTSVTTPGEVIDVIVTDHGVAVNPKRKELADKARANGIKVVDIQDLQKMAEETVGEPPAPSLGDEVIAVIEWRDGTLLDSVYRVK
jgi:citrate lyase subunit alpha/citrate CoA-transferase